MITLVDVSSFQGPSIDWAKLKASGHVDGAYVKLTEGATGSESTDSCGAANLARARNAGLPVGAYHFLSALSAPDAQARHFLQQLDAAGGCDLPVMLDVERGASGKLPPAAWAKTWLGIVEPALGVTPLIYTGAWVAALEHFAAMPELARFPGWVAAYVSGSAPPVCPPWTAWGTPGGPLLWQYTAKAVLPGIPQPCDLSHGWAMPGAINDAALGLSGVPTEPAPSPAPSTLKSSRTPD